MVLSASAVLMVVWLIAAASGPEAYSTMQRLIGSWFGQVSLLGCTFSFFMHLCGGIRHLVWDTGRGFELRTIYASGWAVVVASILLTALTWSVSILMGAG